MIITELCVLEMSKASGKFVLRELAPGVTADEVRKLTEAEIEVGDVRVMAV
jgi:acyl CoA:acetate/3-ketoacid CoA transferase beta subunit